MILDVFGKVSVVAPLPSHQDKWSCESNIYHRRCKTILCRFLNKLKFIDVWNISKAFNCKFWGFQAKPPQKTLAACVGAIKSTWVYI